MNIDPHWTAYLSALLTPIVGALGTLIAYLQWHISRSKIKLDLYEKRFAVYEATLAFYQKIMACTAETIETTEFNIAQKSFIKASRESQFLFSEGSGIFPLLEEWHNYSFKVIEFKNVAKEMASHPETFLKMKNECDEALQFFESSLKKLEQTLVPYLHFRKAYA
jgi:hypothetical protein